MTPPPPPHLTEPTEWEDFDEEDDIIDLRANDVLGGVFQVRQHFHTFSFYLINRSKFMLVQK